MLCFAHGERAIATVVVCFDRGVERGVVLSYERSKFAIRCVDFWATCKIARNDDETSKRASEGGVAQVLPMARKRHFISAMPRSLLERGLSFRSRKTNSNIAFSHAQGRPRILQNLVVCGMKLREYCKCIEFGKLLLEDIKGGEKGELTSNQDLLSIKIKTLINVGSAHSRLGSWKDAKVLLDESESEISRLEDESKKVSEQSER